MIYNCLICSKTVQRLKHHYKQHSDIASFADYKANNVREIFDDTLKCQVCQRNVTRIGQHLTLSHPEVNKQLYYNQYLAGTDKKFTTGKCATCGEPTAWLGRLNLLKGYDELCDAHASEKKVTRKRGDCATCGRPHTKVSFKYMNSNGDPQFKTHKIKPVAKTNGAVDTHLSEQNGQQDHTSPEQPAAQESAPEPEAEPSLFRSIEQ